MKYFHLTHIVAFLLILFFGQLKASEKIPFNERWSFEGRTVSGAEIKEFVSLPHSWNTADAQLGIPYYRGACVYSKQFDPDESWKNKRIFIRFEGVNIIAEVSVNNQEIGVHKGGYAAFCFELTDHLVFGQKNTIEVKVNNEANLEVIPLVGDFNNYGGIYRPVNLIVSDPVCITPLDYASSGVYLRQSKVSKVKAELSVVTKISDGLEQNDEITYKSTIIDRQGNVVETKISKVSLSGKETEATHNFTINNPHLWSGKKDPYLYEVVVEIIKGDKILDSRTEMLGLRYFHVDADKGFFLNGEHIALRGVSRHQDRQNMASAISDTEHREDMDLMLELGINALRLAHYQHAELIYRMSDELGIVVWAEIPWVGMPGGFLAETNGYENTTAFRSNAKQQLHELIRQNYNHPSILMWSIFNEIQNPEGKEPTDFIKELNDIVKEEDPSRLTVGASMLNPEENENIHEITDLIAWNRYFGWYYNKPADMGSFLDKVHVDYPTYKIGISEYGAGGSINQHSEDLTAPNPMGSPHPEEYQAYYHEENLKIFDERPFVWGTFVWNMFDFGSHFRKEGDHYGINDKGLVTYDRKTRKDAFYFYKANWSDQPVLHIASSRFIFRENADTRVKVYSNLDSVLLFVNGKQFPGKSPEKGIIVWDKIKLSEGNNGVVVQGYKNGRTYSDDCVWVLENPYAGVNLFIKIFDFMPKVNKLAIGITVIACLIWLLIIRTLRKSQRLKRIMWKTIFFVLIIFSVLLVAVKFLVTNMMGN